jgi:hypothetical protein
MIISVDRECFPVCNSLTGLSIHIQPPYSFDSALTTDNFQNYPVLIQKLDFPYDLAGHPLCTLPSSYLLKFFESARHVSEAVSQKRGADNKVKIHVDLHRITLSIKIQVTFSYCVWRDM